MITAADLVGVLGALGAAGSLYLHWRTFRRERAEQDPIAEAEIIEQRGLLPGWHMVRLTVRSRSTFGWKVEEVRVAPRGSRIAAERDLKVRNELNELTFDPLQLGSREH